ncbi:zf-HC2 domain-containing protein [Sphingomonas nostoxanthinifaciens]|uniref:zf-HC2 domain-containing protein n=1 Tax=Sphingomonas nostoxanthinifaciens TaxID=2872652 RepID=UPI001CC21B86|nr:zf-HC2 domain-containing protein [Sphingomonas nostoxanthinifaciens]UAK23193.1 zf-HC2 domain-containing protein [Sphingomonas nostoxanthinifaciens]
MSELDRPTPHDEAQLLLPWYATGQLDDADRRQVDDHLADCGACRAALATEQAIGRRVANLSLDVEVGWDDMRQRLARQPAQGRRSFGPRLARRPRWIGLALAAQLVLLVSTVVTFAPIGRPAAYHVLSATPAPARGNALIMFRPEAKADEMMHALASVDARIVDGPTDAGAWLARVAPRERADRIARLRAQPAVAMAEPIDP